MNAKKENVFRALKDQPLIVTSWLCRFGWHTWTHWSKAIRINDRNYQRAECIHCNKTKVNKIKDQDNHSV